MSTAWPAERVGTLPIAVGFGVNEDALTMQECRARLALPRARRLPAADPTIDKDAICTNMLSGRHGKAASPAHRASAPAKAASAAAAQPPS